MISRSGNNQGIPRWDETRTNAESSVFDMHGRFIPMLLCSAGTETGGSQCGEMEMMCSRSNATGLSTPAHSSATVGRTGRESGAVEGLPDAQKEKVTKKQIA